ncbi:MAG: MOSC domain-containing protein [Elusimicrobia bacterium]|nr:MOSC domain-containing protein [Elusimicrobiota bacterium]
MKHLTWNELEAGLDGVRQSPKDEGSLELIVRRPEAGEREVLEEGELNPAEGLVGDNWSKRGSSRTPDGKPDPATQLTIMNSRAAALVAREKNRWQLAGDQLFIDLDLSSGNLPPGTKLVLGSAVIAVSAEPHTGCKQFSEWFGPDAAKFVNSPAGKQLNLRGINARVVKSGTFRVGDVVKKI